MATSTHSRAWTDAYPRGSRVDCRIDGVHWERCVVIDRTRSGLPIVKYAEEARHDSHVTFRIDRKGDIRQPEERQ